MLDKMDFSNLKINTHLIIYIFFNVFGTISAILGNLLIFGAVLCTKELQTVTSMIIINLALADFIIGLLVNSFAIIGVLGGEQVFSITLNMCSIVSSICFLSCFSSLVSMALLSFNRYIFVCKNHIHSSVFSFKKTFAYCIMIWLSGMIINLKTLTTPDFHHYDTKMQACVFNRKLDRTFTLVVSLIFLIIPSFCLAGFYIKIFTVTLKSKSRVMSHEVYKQHNINVSIRISLGLFGSLILFTVSALPFASLLILDYDDKFPSSLYLYFWLLFRLNSALNPIFYGLTNSLFKKGYQNIFNTLLCRPNHQLKNRTSVVHHF